MVTDPRHREDQQMVNEGRLCRTFLFRVRVHRPARLLARGVQSRAILGKRLTYPLVITGMTGGAEEVGVFNREIAALASRMGIGFGVGLDRLHPCLPRDRSCLRSPHRPIPW